MYGPIVVAPLEVLQNPLVETPLARLDYDEMVSFIEKDLWDEALVLKGNRQIKRGKGVTARLKGHKQTIQIGKNQLSQFINL